MCTSFDGAHLKERLFLPEQTTWKWVSGFRAELSSWQEQVRARFAALVLHGGEQSKSSADCSGPSLSQGCCCCIPRGHRGIKVRICPDEEWRNFSVLNEISILFSTAYYSFPGIPRLPSCTVYLQPCFLWYFSQWDNVKCCCYLRLALCLWEDH